MPHTSITAVVEIDDLINCDPAPLLRFLRAGRHIWAPGPGRVTVWRDDLDDDVTRLLPVIVMNYWSEALRLDPHLPYAAMPGGRCVMEMFAAGCGPGALRSDTGTVVIDALVGHVTLDEWGGLIRAAATEYGAAPDAVQQHLENLESFLQQAMDWERW